MRRAVALAWPADMLASATSATYSQSTALSAYGLCVAQSAAMYLCASYPEFGSSRDEHLTGQGPTVFALVDDNLAIDDHRLDADGIRLGMRPIGAIDHSLGVE
jgi:hypothetical protein